MLLALVSVAFVGTSVCLSSPGASELGLTFLRGLIAPVSAEKAVQASRRVLSRAEHVRAAVVSLRVPVSERLNNDQQMPCVIAARALVAATAEAPAQSRASCLYDFSPRLQRETSYLLSLLASS